MQCHRTKFDEVIEKLPFHFDNTAGDLNYVITQVVRQYLNREGMTINYTQLNEVIGVLECAKLELYRRLAVPYEDKKIIANGDVY